MSADLSHVPTEGMQRTTLLLLAHALDRLEERSAEFDEHDERVSVAYHATPEDAREWARRREVLVGQLLGAVDGAVRLYRRAVEAKALPCLETESRLRAEHADREVSP